MSVNRAKNPAVFPPDPDYPSVSLTGAVISMRPDAAASLTGATVCFIEEQIRDGKLPFVWLGKRKIIYYSDLVAWAQKERARQLKQESELRSCA
jgi:excisionase family DNA binding protein